MTVSRIQVLDDLTANQIAAGEVVERPANALKEMIENSLDANAKRIKVEVRGGGRKLLKVSDDGDGMTPEELPLAILRHATSKIRNIDDLDQLHSLGFRGEALASIAAVSHLTLMSRTASQSVGHVLEIKGTDILRNESCGTELGTTIQIEDLFFNMPAREKFMKSDGAEHRAISEMMTRFALARPDVSFLLEVEGKRSLFTQGSLSLAQVVGSLFGSEVENAMLPVNREDPFGKIDGLIGKPTLIKSTRSHQFFFINGRWIQSRMLSQAVEQAYESMMPKKGFAFVVLNIEIDPSHLDVNIHPQKTEIRFKNERDVFRIVRRGVQDALSEGSALPRMESRYHTELPKEISYEKSKGLPFSFQEKKESYGTISQKEEWQPPKAAEWKEFRQNVDEARNIPKSIWEEELPKEKALAPKPQEETNSEPLSLLEVAPEEEEETVKWEIQPLGQVGNSYIIARTPDELILIDQHAAHERILFDELLTKREEESGQIILTDWILSFGDEEIEALLNRQEELLKLGWKFSIAGPKMLRVEESPNFLGEKEAEEFIRQMMHQIMDNPSGEISNFVRHAVGHVRSCKAALKAGKNLHMQEIYSLLDQLQKTDNPYTCPHGRPVVIRLSLGELAKMFKRT